jgi:hypothetical protein
MKQPSAVSQGTIAFKRFFFLAQSHREKDAFLAKIS